MEPITTGLIFMTADGALGLEAKTFICHLADKIAVHAIWHKSYSEVLGYVRARMLFAVLPCYESVYSRQ